MRTRRALRSCLPWAGAAILALVPPAAPAQQKNLAEQGRRLFFGETFAGNGRTCGTCHPADNDYTIDPAYVARLPATDPLFVGVAGLEDAKLLRARALVTVHADGFGRAGVPRGVPSLLGIGRALRVEPGSLIKPGA